MDIISEENDFKQAVCALFVPKGVRGVGSAMSVSWVEVMRIGHIIIGLSEARELG